MVRLFKPTSYRKGTAMAVTATGVWKLISFANALLVAAFFGVTQTTDIYFYIIMLVGVVMIPLYQMNTAVVIPEAQALEARAPQSGQPLLNLFLLLYATAALLGAGIGFCCPVKILSIFSRFPAEQLSQYPVLLFLGFSLFGLQLLCGFLSAILEMYHRFSVALLTPLNALLPLVCLLLFGKTWGITSMLLGFNLAYLVQTAVSLGVLKWELNWHFTPQKVALSKRMLHNLLSTQIQALMGVATSLLPIYLLSGYPAGLVSALNYAKQLTETPTEILTQRVTNLSKIQLAEYIAQNRWKQAREVFLAVNHFLVFLLAPLAVFSCFYAPEIITMFFRRGAFSLQDVHMAAGFLRPLLFITLLSGPGFMQWSLLSASRTWKEYLPYSFIGNTLLLVSLPLTMGLWGAYAYPYTQLACGVIGLAVAYLFFKRYITGWEGNKLFRALLRLLVLNLLALVPAAVYGYYGAGTQVWLTVFTGGIIYVSALAGLTYASGDLEFFFNQCLPRGLRR